MGPEEGALVTCPKFAPLTMSGSGEGICSARSWISSGCFHSFTCSSSHWTFMESPPLAGRCHFHLCRAHLQKERSGEPSKSPVYHSSGVQLVRLSGFRFCLLLLPVCASVSSSVQWGDNGITVRITRVHIYIKYYASTWLTGNISYVIWAVGTPHHPRQESASCVVLAYFTSLPRDKLSLATHFSLLGPLNSIIFSLLCDAAWRNSPSFLCQHVNWIMVDSVPEFLLPSSDSQGQADHSLGLQHQRCVSNPESGLVLPSWRSIDSTQSPWQCLAPHSAQEIPGCSRQHFCPSQDIHSV